MSPLITSTASFGVLDVAIWVLKLDPSGTVEWQNLYQRAIRDIPSDMLSTEDGGVLIASRSAGHPDDEPSGWLLKLGALIRITLRKVWVSLAAGSPYVELFQQV